MSTQKLEMTMTLLMTMQVSTRSFHAATTHLMCYIQRIKWVWLTPRYPPTHSLTHLLTHSPTGTPSAFPTPFALSLSLSRSPAKNMSTYAYQPSYFHPNNQIYTSLGRCGPVPLTRPQKYPPPIYQLKLWIIYYQINSTDHSFLYPRIILLR